MNTRVNPSKLIAGATGDWEVVIGLEVHAQVTSQVEAVLRRLDRVRRRAERHVSLVDAAMPGMLPVINEECVAQAVRTGLGLKAKINLRSVFDRKNYFYPDLPQGYQISQYKYPIVGEGEVVVDLRRRRDRRRSASSGCISSRTPASRCTTSIRRCRFVDLNRSGVALMEIVSKPDMRSAEEAKAYRHASCARSCAISAPATATWRRASLRADVNVSVRKPGEPLGTRCEIKNVNSIRFIGQAIEYEARRQIGIIEDGGTIEQETRLFDPDKGETRSMRSKEEAHDYRYFPDPDLLPLEFDAGLCRRTRSAACRNCRTRRRRASCATIGLSRLRRRRAGRRARQRPISSRRCARQGARRQARRQLGDQRTVRPAQQGRQGHRRLAGVAPRSSARIVDLIAEGTISGKIAKDLFEIVWTRGRRPARDRRGARHEAGHRHSARSRRRSTTSSPSQPGQGRAGASQAAACSAGSSAR